LDRRKDDLCGGIMSGKWKTGAGGGGCGRGIILCREHASTRGVKMMTTANTHMSKIIERER